jgi:SAM-dependent methyltransferase
MITYRCPICMKERGGLRELTLKGVGLQCLDCSASFPIIDETPILLSDLAHWFSSQGEMVFLRTDLPAEIYDLVLGFPGPLRSAQRQLYNYLQAPRSELHDWVERKLQSENGKIVDLGCGIGLHNRNDILGVDLNWTLLQRYPGEKLVADILSPPFSPKSMDCILLLNVLDSCRAPFLLLQQALALLQDAGRILFSSPFAWNDDVTSPKEQLSPEWVRTYFIQEGYTIEEEECSWFVQSSPRSCTRYQTCTWEIYRK